MRLVYIELFDLKLMSHSNEPGIAKGEAFYNFMPGINLIANGSRN
jgi:hypothetical protein